MGDWRMLKENFLKIYKCEKIKKTWRKWEGLEL